MTINKAIAKIWHCIVSVKDCTGNEEFVEALELSLEIMHKYQEIERIYQNWNVVNDFSYNQAMQNIGEVVEDGDALPNDERSKTCTKCVSFSNTCRICHNRDMYKENDIK